ncbi:ABC transporter permease [Micromonospora sp. WMMA1363]|uniref:ABC transporter permease n=1 Tax=Micromonospora sp. WMMA1363 TaxID=3053985 RepID=UPI00259C72D5|nr:ABC transporter permease [Micromonospora sp. WMMA1363]MDM4718984.1 ABC transporter permease [Micromonospora sp. WMMA1363]
MSAGFLSRQTVRTTWPAYLGAFVALAVGIVLIGVTVTLIAAVDATLARGVTPEQRRQLDDLTSMFGIMSAVSLFLALFVVGSTFGFAVVTRRRAIGLLRLVGATPRQIRRLILGESTVVAVTATVVGCGLTTLVTPAALRLVRTFGITDLRLTAPSPLTAWLVSGGFGMAVALLGAWRSSRRAARIPPTAALREAALERRRLTVGQALVATLSLAVVVAAAVLATRVPPLFTLILAVLLPEVIVVGLMATGPLVIPRLAGLLARPFVDRDVAARLARDELRADNRTTSAVAAPVVAISAIAGSMLIALSFGVDWTSAQDRAHLSASVVVSTTDPSAAAALAVDPAVAVADVRRSIELPIGHNDHQNVDVIDVNAAIQARGLSAVQGDLAELHGPTAAVTRSFAVNAETGLGATLHARIDDRPVDLRVVAVVADTPDLYAEVLIPADLVPHLDSGPATVFVRPHPGVSADDLAHTLVQSLAGPDTEVLTAGDWIERAAATTRRANNLGLLILLGPAGLYSALAIVNVTLIGAAQRRRPNQLVRLLGATPRQVRRAALWQAALVTGAGLVLGTVTTAFLGWLVWRATTADLAGTGVPVPVTVPWLPMLGTAGVCVALAATAAVAGARVNRR